MNPAAQTHDDLDARYERELAERFELLREDGPVDLLDLWRLKRQTAADIYEPHIPLYNDEVIF